MASADDIAIIGMAGRFPGADSVEAFWENLVGGVESITRFSDDEVRAAGIGSALVEDPHYVKAGGVLDRIEWFDAAFFGYTPREAEVMDPQQRLFLECAWQALEIAGYDSERYRRPVGVYAGMSMNTYVLSNLIFNPAAVEAIGEAQAAISNLHDHLATRVSYKLDLRGPSFTVQTTCSTSLVAVHLACQGLLAGECDMALAGGVSIGVPQKAGYLYHEGGTHSPDGHCRAFDAAAAGMIGGSGLGIVVLKRLDDAAADCDHVVAVVKGTAINNDGAAKVGYTAPSVEGQARVVRTALRVADVPAESIGYVEAHGTGTAIGDPIEVEALARAFQAGPARPATCGIGSVKTNIGHLDAAAGIAGLIKTALALERHFIPASLHFEGPNPRIDFAATPFYVVQDGREWPSDGAPRRAGVSAFGIGGTNAHAVLEEAPRQVTTAGSGETSEICVLSARTTTALAAARNQLADHLERSAQTALGDVAWTLQVGRRAFQYRSALVVRSRAEAPTLLRAERSPQLFACAGEPIARETVLLFPGQGAQHPGMAHALYQRYGVFRDTIDRIAAAMAPTLDVDLRELLGYHGTSPDAAARLRRTEYAQPALFAVDYALAELLVSAGVKPAAYLGHSIGEYVAACLAGVFTLHDAAALVVRRGQLMAGAPPGAMLAVLLPERELLDMLDRSLSLAAVNGQSSCVVSGEVASIERLAEQLARSGTACSHLHTSHAFHSHLMDDVMAPFAKMIASRSLSPPRLPFVSNLTGRWITPGEATDPLYWVRHLREPVRFADGVVTAAERCSRLIETGPGTALTDLAKSSLAGRDLAIVATLPRAASTTTADESFLAVVARLWTEHVTIEWDALRGSSGRRRVALPTYPFERLRYWIDPVSTEPVGLKAHPQSTADTLHFHVPAWLRTASRAPGPGEATKPRRWLLLCDGFGLGEAVGRRLVKAGHAVTSISGGEVPRHMAAFQDVLESLRAAGAAPDAIVHCISVLPDPATHVREARPRAFESLVAVARALDAHRIFSPLRLEIVTSNLHDVLGTEPLDPLQAVIVGPLRVIPQEYPNIRSRNIDVRWDSSAEVEALADEVVAELSIESSDQEVAWRGGYRWTQHHVPAPEATMIPSGASGPTVIFGGLGNIGLVAAQALAAAAIPVVLVGRSPDRNAPALLDLRQRGAELLVLDGDVEDETSVRQVFAQARERFGAVRGVIHAAGPSGAAAVAGISDMDDSHVERQFGAKVKGLLALRVVVEEYEPEFVILTSSLSTVLGGLGFGAYGSANAVMDAFAAARTRTGPTRWVAINWDGWRFDAAVPGAIDRASGGAAFTRLVRANAGPRVLVVAGDLEQRRARWINPGAHSSPAPAAGAVSRARTTAVVSPENDLERLILQIWHELLGVGDIGIDDNFFELGGHSLLATQLVSRLRRSLLLDVPLRVAFEAGTVRAIAAAIAEREPAPGQALATAKLRLQVGAMSPQQIKAMIAARQPVGDGVNH